MSNGVNRLFTVAPRALLVFLAVLVASSIIAMASLAGKASASPEGVSGSSLPGPLRNLTLMRSLQAPDGVWQFVDEDSIVSSGGERQIIPQVYRTARVNEDALRRVLATAPLEFTQEAKINDATLSVPTPDGTFWRFRIVESPIMETTLAEQYPEIKTYRGQGIDQPSATARFDVTPAGFHGLILSERGTIYVDPYAKGDTTNYIIYFKSDYRNDAKAAFSCYFSEDEKAPQSLSHLGSPEVVNGTILRTYRLALAATGEYTAFTGGTVATALAAMTTTVNRVDGIYEREVAARMVLVANENLIIYTNAGTDPYTNSSGTTMLGQNQTNLDAVIGSANYDIGHVLSTGGGGVASLGVVCSPSSKARGVTGSSSPVGDGFDVDYVAHEMGHQFGGFHTFNGTVSNCGGGNRSSSAAYETGSGSTIMAYAGICGSQDLQPHSDDYFHVKSLEQIAAFIGGTSCDVETSTGNSVPAVTVGGSVTIPKGTPFTLTAAGSDPNGDALTYCWEEYDLGPSSPPDTDADGIARPIFRSFNPASSTSRTFPKMSDVLNNTSTFGEALPAISRTMSFQVTIRDNRSGGGGINTATKQVIVNASAGPFLVSQPNTTVIWAGGTQQTVTWDVANTSSAPVNAANVNISLSTDGGNTFPVVLAASTPNDGNEVVTVPNTPTTSARVKVAAVANVFFDTSNANFTITPSAPPAYQGFLDAAGCGIITGWAWDANSPSALINVDIFDGTALVTTIPATLFREDIVNAGIGNGFHGFSFTVPASLKDGQPHTIHTYFAGTTTELGSSPRVVNCNNVAPAYQGYHDGAGCNTISGWAWNINDPDNPINVDIYDGGALLATVPAVQFRPDLVAAGIGNGFHGFALTLPLSLKDGQFHSIRVKFPGTNTDLGNTPRTIGCNGASPVLQGYHDAADCNVLSGWAWDRNDPDSPINVAIFSDGHLISTVLAIQFRQDLANAGIGNGYHAFSFNTPAALKDGQPHSILVRFSGSVTSLSNSPRTITCPP